jgi:hypothetical protein
MLQWRPPVARRLASGQADKNCPLCGVTMFAGESIGEGGGAQSLNCPRCGCVITSATHDPVCDQGSFAATNRKP